MGTTEQETWSWSSALSSGHGMSQMLLNTRSLSHSDIIYGIIRPLSWQLQLLGSGCRDNWTCFHSMPTDATHLPFSGAVNLITRSIWELLYMLKMNLELFLKCMSNVLLLTMRIELFRNNCALGVNFFIAISTTVEPCWHDPIMYDFPAPTFAIKNT